VERKAPAAEFGMKSVRDDAKGHTHFTCSLAMTLSLWMLTSITGPTPSIEEGLKVNLKPPLSPP